MVGDNFKIGTDGEKVFGWVQNPDGAGWTDAELDAMCVYDAANCANGTVHGIGYGSRYVTSMFWALSGPSRGV